MEQDHPDIVTVSQPTCSLDGAFKLGEGSEPTGAKTPPDPEADYIAGEAAEPADHDESGEIQRT